MADFAMSSADAVSAASITVTTDAAGTVTCAAGAVAHLYVYKNNNFLGAVDSVTAGPAANQFRVGITSYAFVSTDTIHVQYDGFGTGFVSDGSGELTNSLMGPITNSIPAGGGSGAPSPSRLSIGIGGGL